MSALSGLPSRPEDLGVPSTDALHQAAQRAARRVQNVLVRSGRTGRIEVSRHEAGVKVSYPKEHAQLVRAAMASERARIRRDLGSR